MTWLQYTSACLILILSMENLCTAQSVSFAVVNDADSAREGVARVSLPIPRGQWTTPLPQSFTLDGEDHAGQVTPITRWPDGSVRFSAPSA